MSEVINITDINELKHCEYYEGDNGIGVRTKNDYIHIERHAHTKEFLLEVGSDFIWMDREKLAEFIQVAKVFIDSEDKFAPKCELIGINYEVND